MTVGFSLKINSEGNLAIDGLANSKTVREHKGKSLISFPESFCVIDIETTGLDSRFDEIIEIAAIKVENGQIVEERSSLVKPSEEIDEYITELTGISNEMVVNENPINIVLDDFMDFWKGYTLVGHNVNFDINFLYDNSIKHGVKYLSNDFIDTLRISRRLIPELNSHKLKIIAEHFRIPAEIEHRALDDARRTNAIFEQLKSLCLQKFDSFLEFENLFKSKNSKGLKASDITTTETEFDENHPFFEKSFVFTGTLEKMIRRDAMQLVVNLGGICTDNVTKKTNFLVLGNQDYSRIKDNKSSKHKKAENLKLSGQDIEIISENVFYDMLDN
ncbi:hypothetical protein A0U40_05170 [[Bacillus] sp. KCTC 13219]|nr:hypothetical protein A0U40_05170 [[Bacillus] sp. KCTC 13219]